MRSSTFRRIVVLGLACAVLAPLQAEIPAAGTVTGRITAEQAVALAINDIKETVAGYHLRHPRYAADLTAEGVRFLPRGGGPQWRWRLVELGTGSAAGRHAEMAPVRPVEAVYPVTLGSEIGVNDFRISDMGGTGNAAYGAFRPAVAYNSTDNEYLVVWYGDDDIGGVVFFKPIGPTLQIAV